MERQGTTGKQRMKVKGEELLAKVRQLIHEGNIRRITITDASDRTILEIPLTVGVVGAILAPALVAIGAIAALAKDYTLEIERHDATEQRATAETPAEAGELVTTS
jgi:hypothetical protein